MVIVCMMVDEGKLCILKEIGYVVNGVYWVISLYLNVIDSDMIGYVWEN